MPGARGKWDSFISRKINGADNVIFACGTDGKQVGLRERGEQSAVDILPGIHIYTWLLLYRTTVLGES